MSISDLESASGGIVKQTKYLKKNPLRRYFINHYLQTVAELASPTLANTILDVGCGEGFVVQHLKSTLPHSVLTGVDIENDVLKVAQYQNPVSNFVLAGAYELPFAAQNYDLVLCNEVLEHLEFPDDALEEIKRVGKKYFVFSVPREPHYRLANMAAGANWSRWGDDADHCQRWTRGQFIHMLGQQFNVLKVRNSFPWIMVLCQKRG